VSRARGVGAPPGHLTLWSGVYARPLICASASAIGVGRVRRAGPEALTGFGAARDGASQCSTPSRDMSHRPPRFTAGRSPRSMAARTARGVIPISRASPLTVVARDRRVSRETGCSSLGPSRTASLSRASLESPAITQRPRSVWPLGPPSCTARPLTERDGSPGSAIRLRRSIWPLEPGMLTWGEGREDS